jgi:replicative DNA helicase
VAKHRNGPTGEIQLRFEKRYTNFAEVVTGGGRDVYFEGG